MARDRIAAKKLEKPVVPQATNSTCTSITTKQPTSGDKLKAGSFGISAKGKEQAASNRAEVAKKNTVPSGSFGISAKGKEQADANKAEVANKKPESSVPAGSFGISQKGKDQAAKNKAEVASKNNQSDSGNVASKNNQSGSGNIVTYKGKKINLDTVGPKTKEFLQRKTTGENLSNKVKNAGVNVKFTRDKDGTISGVLGVNLGEVISTGGESKGIPTKIQNFQLINIKQNRTDGKKIVKKK